MRTRDAVLILPLGVVIAVGLASTVRSDEGFQLDIPKGLEAMTIPRDNPLTEKKIELGKQLFFDTRLSADNTISCASCHDPEKGWSNAAAVATGIDGQKGGRSVPTIVNSGYSYFQFWDGRAKHVEGQALGPIQNPIEMGLTLDELEEKLTKIEGYRQQFEEVFGTQTVKSDDVAKAIGAFERTVLSGNAPYDRYVAGDKEALSEAAQRGMDVFFNAGVCSSCHSGPNFTDGAFHNIGVGMDQPEEKWDRGRFNVTKLGGDTGAFKTPTLREIDKTAPYMHDGSEKTLEDVVEYYNKGGTPNEYLDEEIFPLKLSDQQKKDLVIFLKEGLSSPDYPAIKPPKLPE